MTAPSHKTFRFHLLALLVVAIWGVTFVCTKVLIGAGMAPAAIFVCRFILAYAGIWAYTLMARKERRVWYGWKDEGIFLLLGVTGGSMYFLTENTALVYTQASNAAFLVGTAPLWTAVLTLLYSRIGKGRFADNLERIHIGWPLIGGTLLALLGMGLMVFEGTRIQLSARGDLLAIGAALCWAVYSLFMGEMTREYGTLTATRKVFIYGLFGIPKMGASGAALASAIASLTGFIFCVYYMHKKHIVSLKLENIVLTGIHLRQRYSKYSAPFFLNQITWSLVA